MTRRSLLLAGAAVPLAGCEVFSSSSEPDPIPIPPHPDEPIRERAAEAELELVALYMAAAAAHPELDSDLARFSDRHLRHVAAIEATAPPLAPGATPTATLSAPAAPAAPPPRPTPPEVAADPEAAVQQLRDAETAAVDARRTDCLEARDQPLATVLASIAACEAAHDRLLRRVG